MQINILGYTYDVVVIEKMSNAGECNTYDQRINLAGDQHKEQFNSTLVHEVVEAINKHLDLGLDHTQISGLETGFYSFLRDNNIEKVFSGSENYC